MSHVLINDLSVWNVLPQAPFAFSMKSALLSFFVLVQNMRLLLLLCLTLSKRKISKCYHHKCIHNFLSSEGKKAEAAANNEEEDENEYGSGYGAYEIIEQIKLVREKRIKRIRASGGKEEEEKSEGER